MEWSVGVARGATAPWRTGAGGARSVRALVATMLALVLLVGVMLVAPIDHDESQYVAAVAAMRHGLPYRDFAFLQTPLHPLLFAPFSALPPGWLVVGLRLANLLCAVGTLVVLGNSLRRHGVARGPTAAAMLLMLTCNAFLFAGSVARNDALPMLLFAGGLATTLRLAGDRAGRPGTAALAGLLLAAAASAKISYALPAATLGVALLMLRLLSLRMILAFAAGGLAGLAPTIALVAIAPAEAWFGIIDYSVIAPQQWRLLVGETGMLSPLAKIGRLAAFAALGPALLLLIVVAAARLRGRGGRGAIPLLLDAALLGALLAAYLPDPTYRQYLVPLLPPLFLRAGMLLSDRARLRGRALPVALAGFALIGLAPTAMAARDAVRRGSPVLALIRDAHAVLRAVGDAAVVTLAPERIAGAGTRFDPRFVAGPFLFRIMPPLAARIPPRWAVMVIADTDRALAAAPPAALLTGTEPRPFLRHPHGLDGVLEGWALRHGYRPRRLPSGDALLWLPPRR
ncbi:hypothetical protein GCM10011380_15020 [Sphingomonas metalli]|uniref:DUF2029 domain-containing protein n=1 Tax=Sphingomonas metalli TaxID=1779358 RepID=A0A916WRR2_9SPHN|nr:glycosyltransferase 87 family protein [Sphingomonas metalli]GGB26497.1 hypothetical protein GCM10011380_15020 [Sphingomonas metalli]